MTLQPDSNELTPQSKISPRLQDYLGTQSRDRHPLNNLVVLEEDPEKGYFRYKWADKTASGTNDMFLESDNSPSASREIHHFDFRPQSDSFGDIEELNFSDPRYEFSTSVMVDKRTDRHRTAELAMQIILAEPGPEYTYQYHAMIDKNGIYGVNFAFEPPVERHGQQARNFVRIYKRDGTWFISTHEGIGKEIESQSISKGQKLPRWSHEYAIVEDDTEHFTIEATELETGVRRRLEMYPLGIDLQDWFMKVKQPGRDWRNLQRNLPFHLSVLFPESK